MGRYIDFDDVVNRYREVSRNDRDATTVNSDFIRYAEDELDSRLSPYYTVPFSSNNITAKDLSIDLAYLKIFRFKDVEKASAVDSYIAMRINALASGKASMMTSSGDVITPDGLASKFYSTTQDYSPVFGMGGILSASVSSSRVQHENDNRN